MSDQVCGSCKFIGAKVVANGAANELVVTCMNGHAPIWLFSGGACRDYESKIDQKTGNVRNELQEL